MYKGYRPDPGETLISLARSMHGTLVCHASDRPLLQTAGISAKILPRGGPLRGEIWMEVAQ